MYVTVNGARLFVDIEGAGLVPDGPRMRAKPTLVLLHGGPGFDHTMFKPEFGQLADVAQIVYYDHRGNGRSVHPDTATWTLAQWADDLKGLCDALGIEKPIVCGLSFGGFVAQAYATRHPDHPGKLVLASTAARQDLAQIVAAFERIGGAEIAAIARDYWSAPTPEKREVYIKRCHPLYRVNPTDTRDVDARRIVNNAVNIHFSKDGGDFKTMDFRPALARVRCPTLVMAGERDPITPISLSEEIVAALPSHLVRFERFPDCGHGVHGDAPARTFRLLREFIVS